MENQYPPVIAKSLEVIKRFEEKFGWFSIRVYQFPQIDGFSTFLEFIIGAILCMFFIDNRLVGKLFSLFVFPLDKLDYR